MFDWFAKERNTLMDFIEAVDYLKNSLIYQMSLGSKELFHSNVWWWLIDNDNNFIKAFIPDFDPSLYASFQAVREENDRDILIKLEDCAKKKSHVVIENKIKTLPTLEQLKKYTVNLGKFQFVKGVLTGIGPCVLDLNLLKDANGVSGDWSYVSYDKISNRILALAMVSESSEIRSHKAQIEEYCKILNCINTILYNEIHKHENALIYDCDDALYALRIADIFKKHKGSDFFNYIKSRKTELEMFKPDGYKLVISQGFNNGKTTIDIRFSNWVNEKTPYNLLGVQIEGNSFRLVAEKSARYENVTSDTVYCSLKNEWFDDSYDKSSNRMIFGKHTTMKPRHGKKYDTYQTNNYCFVYQYFDIIESIASYECLFGMIKEYLAKASRLLAKM